MRIFCLHKWDWYSYNHVEVFEFEKDSIPIKRETQLSGVCIKCGTPQTKTIKGEWTPKRTAS